MKSLGRVSTIVVAAVVALAVLAGGWFLLIQPTRSSITATKAKTAQQQQANEQLQLELATMRAIAKKLPQEQAELAALSQQVPDQVQLPSLLRQIQVVAAQTGVTVTAFTPGQPTPLSNAPGISSVAVNMTVTGGYAELEQLQSALEGLKRTFLVSGFTMTGSGPATGSSTTATSSSSSSVTSSGDITETLSGSVLVRDTNSAKSTSANGATSSTATSSTSTSH